MGEFLFQNGDKAEIKISGEVGEVISHAEHSEHGRQYLLRYKNNAGVATEQWWDESTLCRPE